nr:HlyD family efflux transporter periplasmic adaptor subunit [Staphylococcus canis]
MLVKAFGQGGQDDKKGYDTYKVQKESPIRVTGKVSPNSVKTYQNNSQIGDFVSVQVEDGQFVQQGTPLLNYDLDSTQRQKLVDQLNEAESQGDQQQIDQAIKQLNRYDGQVYNSVNATFSGTVEIVNQGNVNDGTPILRLISNEPEIQTTVSEFDLDKIKVGDDVKVTVTSNGKTGNGKITRIAQLPTSYDTEANASAGAGATPAMSGASEGDEAQSSLTTNNPVDRDPELGKGNETSKYQVMIGELDFDVKNGYTVEATIPLDTIKIPKSALTKDNRVFVVDDKGYAHKRKIQFDDNNGDIMIQKGLKVNEKIIKNPDNKIKDGKKVEVSE